MLNAKNKDIHPAILAHTKQRKKRNCLRCSGLFTSRDAANRICGPCKRSLGDLTMPRIYKFEQGADIHE